MPVYLSEHLPFICHPKTVIARIQIEHLLGGDAEPLGPGYIFARQNPQCLRYYTQPIASFNRKVLILK